MRSGATTSAGRAKKAWGRAGRCWEGVVAMGVAWVGSPPKNYANLGKARISEMLKQLRGGALAGLASLSCFTPHALSQTNTCYSAPEDADPAYIRCEVIFSNGSILSIKDLSDGHTFRIGENGWIPVAGKNCIRNIESGSIFCLSN